MTSMTLPASRVPDSRAAPPLRWGILGTGWIADTFVGSLARNTRQVVQAVGSRTRASADRAASTWGVGTAHATYEALVADPEVDVVYVATPHNFHLPHALLAIEAGKHVLVEKPVGLDAGEARAIGEAAERAGVFCMEAMWTLFLPKFDVVRQVLADGVLGDVVAAFADIGERFDEPHRMMRADLAGGPLLDLGTYAATFATWVLGPPDAVVAVATPAPSGVHGQLAIALRTAGGGTASLHTTMLADSATTASIVGTQGRIDLASRYYLPGPFTLQPRGGAALHWEEPRVEHDALHFEAAEVARRITMGEKGSPLRPWSETVTTLELMDRVREATGIDFATAVAARDRETAGSAADHAPPASGLTPHT